MSLFNKLNHEQGGLSLTRLHVVAQGRDPAPLVARPRTPQV